MCDSTCYENHCLQYFNKNKCSKCANETWYLNGRVSDGANCVETANECTNGRVGIQ